MEEAIDMDRSVQLHICCSSRGTFGIREMVKGMQWCSSSAKKEKVLNMESFVYKNSGDGMVIRSEEWVGTSWHFELWTMRKEAANSTFSDIKD